MIEGLVSLLGVGSGGLFGIVQTWLENKRKERAHKEIMQLRAIEHRQQMEEMQKEAEINLQKVNLQGEIEKELAEISASATIAQADAHALAASYQHDQHMQINTSQWVNNVRSLTRPLLTWLTVLASIGLAVYLAVTATNATDAHYVFSAINGFASTAFGWWFARRKAT